MRNEEVRRIAQVHGRFLCVYRGSRGARGSPYFSQAEILLGDVSSSPPAIFAGGKPFS